MVGSSGILDHCHGLLPVGLAVKLCLFLLESPVRCTDRAGSERAGNAWKRSPPLFCWAHRCNFMRTGWVVFFLFLARRREKGLGRKEGVGIEEGVLLGARLFVGQVRGSFAPARAP